MTIILQHQFWDLVVTEDRFEVGLSFGGIPERLVVPFAAIKSFLDPSVQFGLQFEPSDAAGRDADGKPARAPRLRLARYRTATAGESNAESRMSRPNRAKARKWCGWIVSARNNRKQSARGKIRDAVE